MLLICSELFGCFTNFLWNLWTKILPQKKKFSHLYTWWFGGPGKLGNVCNSGIWKGLLLGYISLKSKPPIEKRFKQVTIHGFQASSNCCLPLYIKKSTFLKAHDKIEELKSKQTIIHLYTVPFNHIRTSIYIEWNYASPIRSTSVHYLELAFMLFIWVFP